MTKEELKLVLEALEEAWYHVGTFQPTEKAIDLYDEARTAIKEALAQTQEPVATLFGSLPVYDTTTPQRIEQEPTWWLVEYHDWAREFVTERPEESIAVEKITALYTTPPQRTWEPIQTAPKDGTDVLVMYVHIDTQIVHNGFWIGADETEDESEIGWWSYEHSEISRIKLDDWMTPTHWLPLPKLKEKNT